MKYFETEFQENAKFISPKFQENAQTINPRFQENDQKISPDFGETNIVHDGINGATFIPSVSEEGVISWTNNGDLPNPKPVSIKGKDGERGENGKTPYIQGDFWYIDGVNLGVKAKGEDGKSITIESSHTSNESGAINTIIFSDGTVITIRNGIDGIDGEDGTDGIDGVSATHSWNGTVLTVTSASGTSSVDLKGEKGDKGDGFKIEKTYTSIVAMNAGFYSDGVPLNGFVLIDTGNVNDEDNAKLFVKGTASYTYLTDLSGSQGIKGEDGEDGKDGRGIVSVIKTSTSGLIDTYTITYTDNGTSTFTVTNGAKGADGTSVSIASVTETTVDGGTNVVTFTDGKTLSVKNGSKGDKGDKGNTGKTGADGKSAFEYAQEAGYTGTETEFAEKLAEQFYVTPEMYEDLVNNKLDSAGLIHSCDDSEANVSLAVSGGVQIVSREGKGGILIAGAEGNDGITITSTNIAGIEYNDIATNSDVQGVLDSTKEYTDASIEELGQGFSDVIFEMYGDDITDDGVPTIREIATDTANDLLAEVPLIGSTTDTTPAEVAEAIAAGRPISLTHVDPTFGTLVGNNSSITDNGLTVLTSCVVQAGEYFVAYELFGSIATGDWNSTYSVLADGEQVSGAFAEIAQALDNTSIALAGKVPISRTVNGKALDSNITLTKADIGLGNVVDEKQYSKSNPPPYPVTSVNNKTGAVSLTAADVNALSKSSNIVMDDGKTIQLSTYGNRFLTLTGNSIAVDMSQTTGGWADNFASVKDPVGDTTTMLGWYGGVGGLTHIYMGGTYSDPALKMTKNGQFTFKSTPKVGSANLALATDIPNSLSDLTADSSHRTVTDEEKSNWNGKLDAQGLYHSYINEGEDIELDIGSGVALRSYTDLGSITLYGDGGSEVGRFGIDIDSTSIAGIQYTDILTASHKGISNGVAELDDNGKILSSQLPSYVDDVVEGYYNAEEEKFYDTTNTVVDEVSGKIYVDLSNNKTYRYSGTVFVEISPSIALGTTSSTAFRGDHGKIAYEHSQTFTGNPHRVSKTDIGLPNVDNVKQYSASNPPPYPVTKVNNKTGDVSLSASDVGALPNTTVIPTKVSQLTNDSNYISSYTETDPTVPSWAKAATKPSYTKSEVGLGNVDNTADANKPVSTAQATAILDAKTKDVSGNAFQRVYSSLIPYGTSIPANVDLNTVTYMKVGNYFCSKNADAKTLTNCPTTSAFMMVVISPLSTTIDNEGGTWVYRLRKLQVYTGAEYVQYCYTNGTAGNWIYGDWTLSIKSNNTASTTSAGLMSAADKTKLNGIDSVIATKADKTAGIFYIEGNSTTEGVWTGTCADITEYYEGLMISYKTNVAGASGLTLNINGLGAVAVVRNTTSAITTHYGVGSILMLIYTTDSDGTSYWKLSDYDADTKTRSSNKADAKMYIIGATTQSTSGQTTYSNKNCYIGTNNRLYSGGELVSNVADIEALIDEKTNSVKSYGAVGDGTADETVAFKNALAANRTVFVPDGTYFISDTLTIGANSKLELSQGVTLNFTQSSGVCIKMGMSSALKGNHATINVPYAFDGTVIYADSTELTATQVNSVPPWTKWDPQWKSGRYVTDINICKKDSRGFHYAVNTTDCKGTAVYFSADGSATAQTFMWGIHYSGLRIAGAFSYGIHAVNFNEGWLHEMRVDAFIDACEIGVCLEDCNNTYISAIIQPRRAYTTAQQYVPYAKYGIKLVRSKNTDLSGSRVWDWDNKFTLWAEGNEYQHISMYGDCSGTIINDFRYYDSGDTRNRIYTDTAKNLKTLTILQEPIDRWFKSIDNKPYFYDGDADVRLATEAELKANFIVDVVPQFTNRLPLAIDSSGNIYNGKGYKESTRLVLGTGLDTTNADNTYSATGFFRVNQGDVFLFKNITMKQAFDSKDGFIGLVYYKSDFTRYSSQNSTALATGGTYYQKAELLEDGMKITFNSGVSEFKNGYVRFSLFTREIGTNPIIAVNEEITYTTEGFLTPTVKIRGENVLLSSPSGKSFKLIVDENGALSTERIQ